MENQLINPDLLKNIDILTLEEQKQICGGATTTEYAILVGLLDDHYPSTTPKCKPTGM